MKYQCIRLTIFALSALPMWMLYRLNWLIYLIVYKLFSYRRQVVRDNLTNAFPEKSSDDILRIEKRYYHHFCDILLEGIKSLGASKAFLQKRVQVENPELMEKLYDKGKSVLLVSGHYNNWEYLICTQPLLFSHKAYGMGERVRDPTWERFMTEQRERYGMHVIHGANMHETYQRELQSNKNPIATLMLADQSPGNAKKAYWLKFLGRDTGIKYGVELLAIQYDMAVVFFHIQKVKRGYYTIKLELLEEYPRKTQYGEITKCHARALEKVIRKKPEYWLWTHKRWKVRKPENYDILYQKYKASFEYKKDTF